MDKRKRLREWCEQYSQPAAVPPKPRPTYTLVVVGSNHWAAAYIGDTTGPLFDKQPVYRGERPAYVAQDVADYLRSQGHTVTLQ